MHLMPEWFLDKVAYPDGKDWEIDKEKNLKPNEQEMLANRAENIGIGVKINFVDRNVFDELKWDFFSTDIEGRV